MQFQVTQQYGVGPEHPIGRYKELLEARKVIEAKLLADALLKVNTTYRIYDWDDLIDTQNAASWQKIALDLESASRSRSGSTFSPTPFATSPRPPGMPISSFKKEENTEE